MFDNLPNTLKGHVSSMCRINWCKLIKMISYAWKTEIKSSNACWNVFPNTETVKHRFLKGQSRGHLLFVTYRNDPPPRIIILSEPRIFTRHTSVITFSKNFANFCATGDMYLLSVNGSLLTAWP